MQGARLDAGAAVEAVATSDAADAGAAVAVLAMRVGVEHPVVAVKTQQVAGFLGRRHARQRNVGEDPDGRVLARVVLVIVPHSIIQHVQVWHGFYHALLLEVGEQQHYLHAGADARQRRRQRLQSVTLFQCVKRCRYLQRRGERRVDDDEVTPLQQLLNAVLVTRQHGQSRQHVVPIIRPRKKGAKTVIQVQERLQQSMTRDGT